MLRPLYPQERILVSYFTGGGWAPEPKWTLQRTENSIACAGNRKAIRNIRVVKQSAVSFGKQSLCGYSWFLGGPSARSLVTTPITLFRQPPPPPSKNLKHEKPPHFSCSAQRLWRQHIWPSLERTVIRHRHVDRSKSALLKDRASVCFWRTNIFALQWLKAFTLVCVTYILRACSL